MGREGFGEIALVGFWGYGGLVLERAVFGIRFDLVCSGCFMWLKG